MANSVTKKGSVGVEVQTFSPGAIIFKEGKLGACAYVVTAGEVEISRDVGGKKVVLGTVGKNGLFGEMAPIEDTRRMATAIATRETTCTVIPRHVFEEKMAHADVFLGALVRVLINNVRNTTDLLVESEEARAGQNTSDQHVAA